MNKKLIFGHKNPDTDSICSALAYADLKKQIGEEVEPVRLGNVGEETQFVLDYFSVEAPRLLGNLPEEASEVILVDHNEPQQSADDLDKVRVVEVIDHHRISGFETDEPLYMRVEPVGCTTTILTKLYKESGVEISKSVAGLMLSAIISDTLLLKSPTCTQQDIDTAHELSEIAGVNLEEYGLSMLKAGANTSDVPADKLIGLDSKEFQMNGATIEVAQVNVVETEDVMSRKEEIEAAMLATIEKKNLEMFMLVVTDILNNDSTAIALGDETAKVEQAFNVTLHNNTAELKGVVSRKKQIIPPLTNAFA